MTLSIITIDVGTLYQDSGGSFSLSPRSKSREYYMYTVMKPLRLLHVDQKRVHSQDGLRAIIDVLNGQMYMLDGCVLGVDRMIIWLRNPISIIYATNRSIINDEWVETIDRYITATSSIDACDVKLSS